MSAGGGVLDGYDSRFACGAQVTLSPNGQYRVQGWVVSAVFHGLALTVTLGLMAQVKQGVPKDPFTWDVSLVEPQRSQETRQAEITPTQEPAKPALRPIAPSPSQPKMVRREARPREVTPVKEQQPTEVQQPKPSVAKSAAPIVQQEAVTTQPTMTVAPVPQTVIQPVITEAPVHPVEAASVTRDLDPPAPPAPATAAVIDAKPAESVAPESAPQTAMATSPTTVVKADYGWLAESLRRRLAEIKRYPSAARLNGWEGKVVLRAVIRADGHLSEVKVHRSSGHETLDNAAMEAIRLVCPLHMTNTIAAAEIAVLVPMVYSLGS